MQVPQLAGPIPIGRRVEVGPRATSLWWVRDTDSSGIPFLNCQVVVGYMFLEQF